MAANNQAQILEQQAREKKRKQWMERVDQELTTADATEGHHSPEQLSKHLDRMVDISAKSDVLSNADKVVIRERVRLIKLKAVVRYVDHLLNSAMEAARDKDRQLEKQELFKKINETFTVAIRLGASDSVKQSVKDRLDIIKQTTAAGDSSKAKLAAERDAARLQQTHPNEQRTFTRWRDPELVVVIDGETYTTIDWSLGGMLVAEVDDRDWAPGQPIDVKVGLTPDKLYSERIEVVRYIRDTRRLAVKCRRFASVLMQLKRDCDADGIEPV